MCQGERTREASPPGGPMMFLRRTGRAVELAVLFCGLPTFYALQSLDGTLRSIRVPMIPVFLLVSLICLMALIFDRGFKKRLLWNAGRVRWDWLRVLGQFIVAGAAMAAVVRYLKPDLFLWFPKTHPNIWAIVMILYPLLSVYPQELAYRAFFFHRYSVLFPRPWQRIILSAVFFGFMHIVFLNWVAVTLSIVGGLLFAWTYHRTQSLLAAAVEHSLYGCLIFTVGLGWYFFHGTIAFAGAPPR